MYKRRITRKGKIKSGVAVYCRTAIQNLNQHELLMRYAS